MKLTLFIFLFFFDGPGYFQVLPAVIREQTAKVVRIVDGDTFDILTKEKTTQRIRMNGIDCPERKQAFYQSAKSALAGYIFNKEVKLIITGRDRNKRMIATVYSHSENINLAMIQNGWAWHFKKYSTDSVYASAEVQARLARKGLWSMDHPVAPWEFRKNRSVNISVKNHSLKRKNP